MEKIGTWAFLLGVLIAIVAGFVPTLPATQVAWVLVILGLIVGFLNIRARETQEFLVACIAIIAVSGFLPNLGMTLKAILTNIIAFVAPAAFLVACRAVWALAEE